MAMSSAASAPLFVLIGHCSPDAGMLRSAVGRVVTGASFVSVNSGAALEEHRHAGAVWLVNRVLDGAFGADDGMSLVAKGAAGADGPAVLLISNFEDAQRAAIALGALPGFGKQSLYAERTAEAIRAAVAKTSAPRPAR